MIKSIIDSNYKEADAVVVGLPYDGGASMGAGADKGPDEVREVLESGLELFDRYTLTEPAYDYKFAYKELDTIKEKAPEEMVQEIRNFFIEEDRMIVAIGGNHSVSIGIFQALAEKYKPEDVTIIQIDAHLDLRDDDSEYNDQNPSKYAHSTPMRRAHELGFNILPVGIRTMFVDEYNYAKENNINFFEWGRADKKTPSVENILESVKTKYVYITIDVDGFDPSVMPGTGTPVPGGMSWEFGEDLIRTLCAKKSVVGADVVEVAPIKDSYITQYAVAQLVYHILSISSIKKHP